MRPIKKLSERNDDLKMQGGNRGGVGRRLVQ